MGLTFNKADYTRKIARLNIIWNSNIESIKPDYINISDDDFKKGISVINNVDFDLLLKLTNKEKTYTELFYSKSNITKTKEIIDRWEKELPLSPPFIKLFINKTGLDSDVKLLITDGNHRMRVCFNKEIDTIDIIVSNDELDRIKKILNIS